MKILSSIQPLRQILKKKKKPEFLPARLEPPTTTTYLFCFLEDAEYGPMSILYRSVEGRLKVKVWTRSYRHVRGICTGYIVAFDKHWNLVHINFLLHCCTEMYSFCGVPFSCQPASIHLQLCRKNFTCNTCLVNMWPSLPWEMAVQTIFTADS